ncbi:MAG: hypothetical protein RLZZ353_1286 [Actinomycetota bacterium]
MDLGSAPVGSTPRPRGTVDRAPSRRRVLGAVASGTVLGVTSLRLPPASAATSATVGLGSVTDGPAISPDDTRVTISWDDIGATYTVEQSTDGGTTWTTAVAAGATSPTTITGLTNDQLYSFRILAESSGVTLTGGTTSTRPRAAATGGTETVIGVGGEDWRVHSFTDIGTATLTFRAARDLEYLIVGGGGSGGKELAGGGGGGAGGRLTNLGGTAIGSGVGGVTVVVGAGGAARAANGAGADGGSSSAFGLTAAGGGGGGAATTGSGRPGGSGGGGGGTSGYRTGGTATPSGQGNAGGEGRGVPGGGGGGGGAGGRGGNATTSAAGAAGAGVTSSITGATVTYAAGGAGMKENVSGPGVTPTAGTGSGGGGGARDASGAGASGIVVVRYRI